MVRLEPCPTFWGKRVLVEYVAVHHPELFDRRLGALLRRDEAEGATEVGLILQIRDLAGHHGLSAHVTVSSADAILIRVMRTRRA